MLINWLVGTFALLLIFLMAFVLTKLAEKINHQRRGVKIFSVTLFVFCIILVPYYLGGFLLKETAVALSLLH